MMMVFNGGLEKNSGATENQVDTTFVIFFLAVEFGQSFQLITFDSIFLALTLAGISLIPYFVESSRKPKLSSWITGRMLIIVFGGILGWIFKQSLGSVLPDILRFLPLTLLMVTAMLSCYLQFYFFLKIRFVK